jgi:hypothetical protein
MPATDPATTVTASDLLPELALPAAAKPAPPAPASTASPSPVAPGTLDRKGTPYDPARHIPKMKESTGGWMPRGGRKPNPPAANAGTGATAPAPTPPPAPAAPLPPIPEVGPSDAPTAAASPAQGEQPTGEPAPARPAGPDVTVAHETAAELAARATYAVTGAVIGDHKKATATGAEHESLKKGYASFFAYRNIVLVGGIALAAVVIAYLLGEARREEVVGTVKKLFAKKKPDPRPVDIDPAPAASSTAGNDAAGSAPTGEPRPSRVDSW